MTRLQLLVTAALCAAGCGVNLSYTEIAPARPRPARAPDAVQVFTAAIPRCAFTEIALMEWFDRSGVKGSYAKIILAMRRKAGEHGADAIVITSHNDAGKHGEHHAITAAAIQYREQCEP